MIVYYFFHLSPLTVRVCEFNVLAAVQTLRCRLCLLFETPYGPQASPGRRFHCCSLTELSTRDGNFSCVRLHCSFYVSRSPWSDQVKGKLVVFFGRLHKYNELRESRGTSESVLFIAVIVRCNQCSSTIT